MMELWDQSNWIENKEKMTTEAREEAVSFKSECGLFFFPLIYHKAMQTQLHSVSMLLSSHSLPQRRRPGFF